MAELDLSLSGHPGEENGDQSVPVSGIGIRVGAQVASLRCPILRADQVIIPRKLAPSKAPFTPMPMSLRVGEKAINPSIDYRRRTASRN
jgi:hypothetical protein